MGHCHVLVPGEHRGAREVPGAFWWAGMPCASCSLPSSLDPLLAGQYLWASLERHPSCHSLMVCKKSPGFQKIGFPAEKTGIRRISTDQERVQRATRKDNLYLQYLGRSTAKWETPADQYMTHRTGRSSKVSTACHLTHRGCAEHVLGHMHASSITCCRSADW